MISIVICSVTPSKFSAVTQNLSLVLGEKQHQFIGIHDARSLAEAYNRGIRQSQGDFIIFCHDDIEILDANFGQRLRTNLDLFDLIGVAGSTKFVGPQWAAAGPPHIFGQVAHLNSKENCFEVSNWSTPARRVPGICLMDGVFLAGRREMFEDLQFDEDVFTGFHHYDLDFTLRASEAGYSLAVCNDLPLLHFSKGNWGGDWEKYSKVFMNKHGSKAQTIPPEKKWSAWCAMQVRVSTKQGLIEFFQSPYWND